MQQTKRFKLNQWTPEDRILREDFNNDNLKIENALQKSAFFDRFNGALNSNVSSFDFRLFLDWQTTREFHINFSCMAPAGMVLTAMVNETSLGQLTVVQGGLVENTDTLPHQIHLVFHSLYNENRNVVVATYGLEQDGIHTLTFPFTAVKNIHITAQANAIYSGSRYRAWVLM